MLDFFVTSGNVLFSLGSINNGATYMLQSEHLKIIQSLNVIIITDRLMIAYIALFSALLSRLTVLA